MGLEVKVLDLGDIALDTSFLVLALEPGRRQEVPTFGFLITGGEAPIVVDTGFDAAVSARRGRMRLRCPSEGLAMIGIGTRLALTGRND